MCPSFEQPLTSWRQCSQAQLDEQCPQGIEYDRSDCSMPCLVGCLLNEQLQGKLFSSYKTSRAYPGVLGPHYACISQ
jgi:hypothetical protein